MQAGQKTAQRRARLVLVGLFALFFLPVIAAVTVAVKAPHWIPFGRINHGDLVEPPLANALRDLVPLDAGAAIERGPSQPWILVHVGHSSCDSRCEYALAQMRQARLALGKDANRVQRWWLVRDRPTPGAVQAQMRDHPGLRIGLLGADSPLLESTTTVQLVDPAGFLVLRYPFEDLPEDKAASLARALLKDFKRLLRISKQG